MTTRLAMHQVDAFTDRLFGGNPAAVLILNDELDEATMQAVAAENNLSETAFARTDGDGWDLRWFTPSQEVDFCGHATLATAHVLAEVHGVAQTMVFRTRVGELRASPLGAGAYRLDFPSLAPEPVDGPPAAIAALFADPLTGPPAATFRNGDNLFVELADEAAVRAFAPDLARIREAAPLSLVVTARGEAHDFVSRYFAPNVGIDEDPATGSIHAVLAPYWAGRLGRTRLSAFQASARGARLDCEVVGDRVLIEGRAVTFMTAEIRLPG